MENKVNYIQYAIQHTIYNKAINFIDLISHTARQSKLKKQCRIQKNEVAILCDVF